MARDKNKFKSLGNKKDGKVIPGNNAPTKVLVKGRAKINKYRRATNILLVQGLKHNILSVGLMVVIVFTSTKCKVIGEESGKVIARGYINLDKLYMFKEMISHRNEENSSSSSDSE